MVVLQTWLEGGKVYWDVKLIELKSIVVFDYIIDMNCKAVLIVFGFLISTGG